MKKIISFCGLLALSFISCTSDDEGNSQNIENAVLPKVVESIYSANYSLINTSSYNNNKLISIKSEGRRRDFTYNGNFIQKEVQYRIENNLEIKEDQTIYEYSNGKLSTVFHAYNFTVDDSSKEKYELVRDVYTYNSDGTVKIDSYHSTLDGLEDKENYGSTILTFEKGNLIKKVSVNPVLQKVLNTELYEYDNKNNPNKNILGINLLTSNKKSNLNNIVKTSILFSDGFSIDFKTSYEYDSNGYPTKATYYNSDGTSVGTTNKYIY